MKNLEQTRKDLVDYLVGVENMLRGQAEEFMDYLMPIVGSVMNAGFECEKYRHLSDGSLEVLGEDHHMHILIFTPGPEVDFGTLPTRMNEAIRLASDDGNDQPCWAYNGMNLYFIIPYSI